MRSVAQTFRPSYQTDTPTVTATPTRGRGQRVEVVRRRVVLLAPHKDIYTGSRAEYAGSRNGVTAWGWETM